MKILLLAPLHREKAYFQAKTKNPFLAGQAHSAWLTALKELGQEVFLFRFSDSLIVSNRLRVNFLEYLQKKSAILNARYKKFFAVFYFLSLDNFFKNLKLLNLAKKAQPKAIFISGGISFIFPSIIKNIKDKYKSKVILFSGINPLLATTGIEKQLVRSKIVDLVVENDAGYARLWRKIGAKNVVVLPISSVDPKLHKRLKLTIKERTKYACDVCFVGTLNCYRQEILAKLTDFNIKIWGDIPPGIKIKKDLEAVYKGQAFGVQMVKIFNAAKIVLNFQPQDMTNGGNMRSFEIPGCGAFQLADRVDKKWFYQDREIILFNDVKDLREKINYYLSQQTERKSIAARGFARAHKEHTYKHHFSQLLKII